MKMANEIISYHEMCGREGISLQRGMNFRIGKNYSVILMSVRPNAPYKDQVEKDGTIIIYEGHDVPKSAHNPNPKLVDQPEKTDTGRLTENGKFHKAAQDYRKNNGFPERVRVYEKVKAGIWSYNGLFHLIDSWKEKSGGRFVFKFKLIAIEEDDSEISTNISEAEPGRVIPTWVKLEVWKRDKGKCRKCGSSENLHFDHIIPYSKGGSSETPENIQLLCAKHNLEKRDKIE